MRKRNFDYSYIIIPSTLLCVSLEAEDTILEFVLPCLVNFYTCTFIHGVRARTKILFQGDTFLFAFEGSNPVVVQLVAIVAMGGVFWRYMCKNVASCLLARGYMISSSLACG